MVANVFEIFVNDDLPATIQERIIAPGEGNHAPRNYYNTSLVSASGQENRVYSVIIIDRFGPILKWPEGPFSMFTPVRPKNHEITDNQHEWPVCGHSAPLTITFYAIITSASSSPYTLSSTSFGYSINPRPLTLSIFYKFFGLQISIMIIAKIFASELA